MENNDSQLPSEVPTNDEQEENTVTTTPPIPSETAVKKRRARGEKKKEREATPKRHLKKVHDSLASIRKPSLKRLGRRAGIQRFTTGFYDRIRYELNNQLKSFMKKCYIYTDSRKRKTISAACVSRVFRESGRPIYVTF